MKFISQLNRKKINRRNAGRGLLMWKEKLQIILNMLLITRKITLKFTGMLSLVIRGSWNTLKYRSMPQVNLVATNLKCTEYHSYVMNEIMKKSELEDVYNFVRRLQLWFWDRGTSNASRVNLSSTKMNLEECDGI